MDLVRRLIGKLDRPAVLDADGLFAFSGTPELLRSCEAPLVLTPHAFEFARLTGQELAFIETNRIDSLRDYSERIDKVVLLKGAPTLIAAPNGEIYLSETGNPGMATGGSGDVLTGVIGALLAYGLEPLAAASAGAYLHGVAGDIAAMESGTFGLIAGDIVSALPDAFIEVLA
jgi:NAD(P)H-hydrate epimerase